MVNPNYASWYCRLFTRIGILALDVAERITVFGWNRLSANADVHTYVEQFNQRMAQYGLQARPKTDRPRTPNGPTQPPASLAN